MFRTLLFSNNFNITETFQGDIPNQVTLTHYLYETVFFSNSGSQASATRRLHMSLSLSFSLSLCKSARRPRRPPRFPENPESCPSGRTISHYRGRRRMSTNHVIRRGGRAEVRLGSLRPPFTRSTILHLRISVVICNVLSAGLAARNSKFATFRKKGVIRRVGRRGRARRPPGGAEKKTRRCNEEKR